MRQVLNIFGFEVKKYFSYKGTAVLSILSPALLVICMALYSMFLVEENDEKVYYIYLEEEYGLDHNIPTTDGKTIYVKGVAKTEVDDMRSDLRKLSYGCVLTKDNSIVYNSGSQVSSSLSSLCVGIVERLRYQQLHPEVNEIYEKVRITDINNGQGIKNRLFACLLPLMLFPLLFNKISSVICEEVSRERENGTTDRNILTGTPASYFVFGKILMAMVAGMLTAVVYFVSMYLCDKVLYLLKLPKLSVVSEIDLSLPQLLGLVIYVLVLCVFLTALSLCISLAAASYKKASSAEAIVYYILLLLGMVSVLKVGKPSTAEYTVPVINVCFVFRDILDKTTTNTKLLITFGSQTLLAVASVIAAVKMFEKNYLQ